MSIEFGDNNDDGDINSELEKGKKTKWLEYKTLPETNKTRDAIKKEIVELQKKGENLTETEKERLKYLFSFNYYGGMDSNARKLN